MSRLSEPLKISPTDPLRELFEACKCGDLTKVRSMVDSTNVNARDTAGRRSTPLHFAAGKITLYASSYLWGILGQWDI
jgi:tankyrase